MSRRMVVPSKSTITLGFVEGDLIIGRGTTIRGEGVPPKLSVSGTVQCGEDCTFECDLLAENLEGEGDVLIHGELEIKGHVKIRDGRLNVTGRMTAKRVNVDKSLVTGKNFEVEDVDVGGSLEVKGNTQAQSIDVGGRFTGAGEVKAKNIDVGGSVNIESKADVDKIDVGGRVSLKGGRVGKIDVGGSLESKDSLEFGTIDVGGIVRLVGKCIGGDIDVGGSCKVDGDLKFGKLDVGGVVEISGSAQGESLDVGGKVRVGASLQLSGKLDVGGVAEINGNLTVQTIDVGGSLKANSVKATDEVSVGGSITTVVGVTAPYVKIGRRGEVTGPIHASEVLISERARVEDVYGGIITMEEEARARNLYGERVFIESKCHVYGEVQYTQSLKTERGIYFAKPPIKVEKIPQ